MILVILYVVHFMNLWEVIAFKHVCLGVWWLLHRGVNGCQRRPWGVGWWGSRLGGEVWRGGHPPPLHSRKNLKVHFKKAAKLARFSSLRRVPDDFCTALYVQMIYWKSFDEERWRAGNKKDQQSVERERLRIKKRGYACKVLLAFDYSSLVPCGSDLGKQMIGQRGAQCWARGKVSRTSGKRSASEHTALGRRDGESPNHLVWHLMTVSMMSGWGRLSFCFMWSNLLGIGPGKEAWGGSWQNASWMHQRPWSMNNMPVRREGKQDA